MGSGLLMSFCLFPMNLSVPKTWCLVMSGVYLSDQELKQLVEVGIDACVVPFFY